MFRRYGLTERLSIRPYPRMLGLALVLASAPLAIADTRAADAIGADDCRSIGTWIPPDSGWEPGVDFIQLVPPRRIHAQRSKVELLVRLLYTSPITRRVEPCLEKWLRLRESKVEYIARPSIRYPHARLLAKMYFSLEEVGRADLQQQLIDWIWQPNHYDTYHTVDRPDESGIDRFNLQFAKVNGLNMRQFVKAYRSDEVSRKVIDEEALIHVTGDSVIVIDGKYGTNFARAFRSNRDEQFDYERAFARLFSLLDYLIAKAAPDDQIK